MMSRDLMSIPTPGCPDGEQLKAWVDRELEATVERTVGAHVDACPTCREETNVMRQLGAAMKELDSLVEPPAQLRRHIMDRVNCGFPSHRSWWTRNPFVLVRWASAAGAVAVAAIVGANSVAGGRGLWGDGAGSQERRAAQVKAQDSVRSAARQAHTDEASNDSRFFSLPPSAPQAMGGASAGMPSAGYLDGHAKTERRSRRYNDDFGGATAQLVTPDDVNTYTRGAAIDDVKRKVARTAVMSVRTHSALEGVQKEIEKRLKRDEGYLESASLSTTEGGERTAAMRLRVPVDKLDDYVSWLASLGEVRSKQVRGEDVTGTWIDQRAEVRELRKEEARLLKVYNTDPKRERRNEARWQLLRVRPLIVAAEERFALTAKLAALSTVELTLVEPEQARIQGNLWQDLDQMARSAVSSFMVAVRVPAALLIWLVVFCPLWLPCVLLYRWATRRAMRWQPR